MNLIEKYNIASCHEADMQKAVAEFMLAKTYERRLDRWHIEQDPAEVFREVSIPEVSRISDIIVKLSDRKVFNIECKMNDSAGVVTQAISHLRWADYSYVCLHAMTYIPSRDIGRMLDNGIGLLLWQDNVDWRKEDWKNRHECIMEVFGAYKSKDKDKKIRAKVFDRLKKHASKTTAKSHIQGNLDLKA